MSEEAEVRGELVGYYEWRPYGPPREDERKK